MGLNLTRRTRRRLTARVREPLDVPAVAGQMCLMDFVHDNLSCGKHFRTLKIIDEGVREVLAIKVDTSLPALRVIRVLEQLKESHPLPGQISVDNDPELIYSKLVARCGMNGIRLHHIQPCKPTQNAYIERFNHTMRREVLDAHLFANLREVRETLHHWMVSYNEKRPHASFEKLPPATFKQQLTDQNKTTRAA